MTRHSEHGFTLVELLVVIVVVEIMTPGHAFCMDRVLLIWL